MLFDFLDFAKFDVGDPEKKKIRDRLRCESVQFTPNYSPYTQLIANDCPIRKAHTLIKGVTRIDKRDLNDIVRGIVLSLSI
ncbi:hypothetical protein PGB90_002594 [Kerria lacca]